MNQQPRSRGQMATDISIALASPLSREAQVAVIDNVCWKWTEYDGKYEGCPWWTQDAMDAYESKFDKPKRIRVKSLCHEHAVPRCVIVELLFGLRTPTREDVLDLLQQYLHAVIVTKRQDALLRAADAKDPLGNEKMPREFYEPGPSFREPWLRYDRFKDESGFARIASTKETPRQRLRALMLQARIARLKGE